MIRAVLSLAALALLTACFPAGHTYTTGPWAGCVTSMDGSTIDCDYRPIERGEPRPDPQGETPPTVEPPITVPDSPVPPREPPVVTPRPTPKPPSDACRPGWGHGDKRCHDGPPGRR